MPYEYGQIILMPVADGHGNYVKSSRSWVLPGRQLAKHEISADTRSRYSG